MGSSSVGRVVHRSFTRTFALQLRSAPPRPVGQIAHRTRCLQLSQTCPGLDVNEAETAWTFDNFVCVCVCVVLGRQPSEIPIPLKCVTQSRVKWARSICAYGWPAAKWRHFAPGSEMGQSGQSGQSQPFWAPLASQHTEIEHGRKIDLAILR